MDIENYKCCSQVTAVDAVEDIQMLISACVIYVVVLYLSLQA